MRNPSADPIRVGEARAGLLPRRLIFRDPERSIVRISPDGTRFAFRAPVGGVLNLWVAPIDRIDEARPVTAVTDRNLGPAIVWMHDNRHVVFFREATGDENWRGWRVELQTGGVRPLTPGPGVRYYIQQKSSHFPSELLIAHNARDRRYFDVYGVNAATGDSTLLQRNEGFTAYFTDQQFQVHFTGRDTDDGDIEYLQRGARVNGPSSAESARRTRWQLGPSNSAPTAANSIGSTAAAATPPRWLRRISQAARCGFSPKIPVPISPSLCSIRSARARLPRRVRTRASRGRSWTPDYRDDFDYLTRHRAVI
jgi:hypothetical protein